MKTDTVFFLKRDRCYIFYQRMMTHSAREEEREYVSEFRTEYYRKQCDCQRNQGGDYSEFFK